MGFLDDALWNGVAYCYAIKEGAKAVVKDVVVPATAVVAGTFIKPELDKMNKLTQIAESEDFDKIKAVMPTFNEENDLDYLKRLGRAVELGQSFREDVQRHLELKKAHEEGYRQGIIDAAKKFANILEQNDNMRIGMFAVGYYIAKLGNNSNVKCDVIIEELGKPNSSAVSPYVRSENNKIIRENPPFEEICSKYLNSLNAEQLKSIDDFLQVIINVGGSSENEKIFYQNKWQDYLNRRNVK